MVRGIALAIATALSACACGDEQRAGPPRTDAGSGGSAGSDASDASAPIDASIAPGPVDGSACNAIVEQHAAVPTVHIDSCLYLEFSTNPPSSGPHYGTWAAYGSYDQPVPRGFTLHSLEHGAIVISYNCPAGCAGEVAAAQAMIDALPPDPACTPPNPNKRVILVPDPKLDVTWAAAAWGWTLKASCFEPAIFRDFYLARFGKGPEKDCTDGTNFGDGGLTLPTDCGEPDAGAWDAGGGE